MKKTIEVTYVKTFEIEINDDALTPEHIEQFEEMMWKLDGCSDKISQLFEYVAGQIFDEDNCYIEGVGDSSEHYSKNSTSIKYECKDSEIEMIIL